MTWSRFTRQPWWDWQRLARHGCQAGEEQGSGSVGLSALEGEEGSPDPLAKPGALLLGGGRLQVARGKGWETCCEQGA